MDEAYIRESILNPQAKLAIGFQPIMPTFQGQVSEEQILQLIAYIRSLGTPQEGGAGTQGGASGGSTTGPTTGGISPTAERSNPLAPTSPRQGSPQPQLPAAPGGGGSSNSNRRQ